MALRKTKYAKRSILGSTPSDPLFYRPVEIAMYTAKDYDRALISPEQVFEAPMDVVTTSSMTPEQKLRVLKSWEANARDLQVATDENMTGVGRPRLGEVRTAILQLCEQEHLDENTAMNSNMA